MSVPHKEIHRLRNEVKNLSEPNELASAALEVVEILLEDNRQLSVKLGALTWPVVLPPTQKYLDK